MGVGGLCFLYLVHLLQWGGPGGHSNLVSLFYAEFILISYYKKVSSALRIQNLETLCDYYLITSLTVFTVIM